MSQPFIGEIRMFAGNFAPAGWMFPQGQLLAISNYDALFNLIGTTYGGDGQENFALPNLQSRLPLHTDNNQFPIGLTGGVETVTLNVQQIPAHNHPVNAATTNQVLSPAGAIPAQPASTQGGTQIFDANTPALDIQPGTVLPGGGNAPHENIQPYLCINFIFSLFGIYPSPN
jgi:microcystin-dependent protein